jgi:hypothetical protein
MVLSLAQITESRGHRLLDQTPVPTYEKANREKGEKRMVLKLREKHKERDRRFTLLSQGPARILLILQEMWL